MSTPPLPAADEAFDYSETLGWELRPKTRVEIQGATTTINAQGWRGAPPRKHENASGTERIVPLGDSIAFGHGVSDEQTFASRLDADKEFEVINLAVPGYGVDQSVLRYEAEGQGWRPSVVILSLCVDNDLADVMLPVSLFDSRQPKPHFVLRKNQLELHDHHVRLTPASRMSKWLQQHSLLIRRLTRGVRRKHSKSDGEHWSARKDRITRDFKPGVEVMAALVGRLRETVERDGGRLVLTIHPNRFSYRHRSIWVTRLLAKPQLQHLQVVSLDRVYRKHNLGFGTFALDDIGHLNTLGNSLTADALRHALDAWSS